MPTPDAPPPRRFVLALEAAEIGLLERALRQAASSWNDHGEDVCLLLEELADAPAEPAPFAGCACADGEPCRHDTRGPPVAEGRHLLETALIKAGYTEPRPPVRTVAEAKARAAAIKAGPPVAVRAVRGHPCTHDGCPCSYGHIPKHLCEKCCHYTPAPVRGAR